MLVVEDRTFVRQAIRLDGRRFVACRFEACQLEYAGGATELEDCTFTDCSWDVRDAAANTVRLLEQVRRSGAYVHVDPDGSGHDNIPQHDLPGEAPSSHAPRKRSAPGLEPGRTSIGHLLADYAEWAVVAVVAGALLLTLFLRG
jgi:hypothetical protein